MSENDFKNLIEMVEIISYSGIDRMTKMQYIATLKTCIDIYKNDWSDEE